MLQLKLGKQMNEADIANCHMRFFLSLKDQAGKTIGSLLLIKFFNEQDELIYLSVKLPFLLKFINKLDKVVELISEAMGERAGNIPYFRANHKSHLGQLYIKNYILHCISHPSGINTCVSTYGLITNELGEEYMSWGRDDLFNMQSGAIVTPMQVGMWIDHFAREKGVSANDISNNYPKIVPNQKFTALNLDGITLANDLMDSDKQCLLGMCFGLGVNDIIKLFKGWGGIKPAVVLLSQPNTGKSWFISLLVSMYGVSEFDINRIANCTLKLDDYTIASIVDQGGEFQTLLEICEDFDRKGNKSNAGGAETFIWTGSGFSKHRTRGGGDVKPMRNIKIGTMNSCPNKNDDGTLSRCFLILWEMTKFNDIYKNKSRLLQDSHLLSQMISQRSIFIHIQKLSKEFLNNAYITAEKK
eukprot:161382_1